MSGDGENGEQGGSQTWSEAHDRHWYHLASIVQRTSERRDRLVVLGAAGALVLSITFLEQVAPRPEVGTVWLLWLSWLFLLVALGSSLWSLNTAEKAHREQMREMGARAGATSPDGDGGPDWDRRTSTLNVVAFWGLVLGAGLLTLFAALNLPPEVDDGAEGARARPEAEREAGAEASGGPRGGEGTRDDADAAASRAEP